MWAGWNGAPEVAAWEVLGGDAPDALVPVASEPRSGFETALGASAELDQVIFDGSSFGTAALAASDEGRDRLIELGEPQLARRLAPYRAGYTPQQRREIERQLRLAIESVVFELLSWQEGFFSFEERTVADVLLDRGYCGSPGTGTHSSPSTSYRWATSTSTPPT